MPKPLDPLGADQPSYAFSGGGQVLGVVLRAEQPLPGSTQHPQFELLRLGPSNGDGAVYMGVGDGVGSGQGTLPAGAYRLYLIAAAQGSVTLNFPASLPEGQLSLTPETSTPLSSGALPALSWSSPEMTVFGQTGELSSQGIVFERAIVTHPTAGQRLEICGYNGDSAQSAGSSAYTMNCPQGQSTGSQIATSSGDLGLWSLTFVNSSGRSGVGGNLSSPLAPVQIAGALDTFAMWMSYDPPQSRPGSSSPGGEATASYPAPYPSPAANQGPPGGSSSQGQQGSGYTTGGAAHPSHYGQVALSLPRVARLHGRHLAIGIGCSHTGRCVGSAQLIGWSGVSRFRLQPGSRGNVVLTLSGKKARTLSRRGSVTAWLEVRWAGDAGINEQRLQLRLVSTGRR